MNALPQAIRALIMVTLVSATYVRAEETATPAEAPAEQPAAAPTEQPAASHEDDKIVIEYIEADIQNVLRTLAAKAGINLIMGDEVVGKVTLHFEDVSYEDAMKLVVENKGYAYVREGKVVKVKSRESLDTEPLEMRVYTLSYAKADDVMKAVLPTLTGRGKVQTDQRSNTLIISDSPSNLTKLAPLLETLDTQTPQVLIEAKFVETTKNPKKDLGFNWSPTLINHELTAGSAAIVDEANGKPISGFQLAKDLAGGAWIPSTALLDAGQAKVVFSYLNQDTDTELLANPRVVTTDNSQARISIATQFPIPNFAFSEQTASLQISGFEYKDIGIILNVLPRINKNSFVTLEVSPEASSSSENATLQSGGGSAVLIPIINTRTATTTVLIKSGHTLAIGGLMRTDTSDSRTKVPLFGDIPGLGAFFRSKSLTKSKRDLLIFLTPTIVGPEDKTGYEQHVNGLPPEEAYANDDWQRHDNAKPRKLFQGASKPATADGSQPATQNYAPKSSAP